MQEYLNIKGPCVYKITNPAGAVYVGGTCNIRKRYSNYKNADCTGQAKMYASIIKYGWDSHLFEVIWSGDRDLLSEMERKFGDEFNAMDKERGLTSILPGYGDIPSKRSKEMIDKFVKSRPWIPISDSAKQAMSEKLKGNTPSRETIRKSIVTTGRAVLQYSLLGEFIAEFPTAAEAARMTGIGRTSIKNMLIGGSKTGAGYIWKYKEAPTGSNYPKKVIKMDIDGNEIQSYNSMSEAGREHGIDATSIRYVICRGGKTAAGFKWKYA